MSIEEYEELSEERPDLLKIIDNNVYYNYEYTDYLYRQLEIRDLILKALHKYFTKHEYYEVNEFLRQLENVIDNENDIEWLKNMGSDKE